METQQKRKAWYQIKIEELETKLAEFQASSSLPVQPQTTVTVSDPTLIVNDGKFNEGYAEGYVDCMHKYGILSKIIRRRTLEQLKAKGPSVVKGGKRNRFQIMVPSL